MPNPNGGKQQLDILELLRQAEEKNHADMNVGTAERKPETEKTRVAESEAPSKKRTKVTKRINAETAELIDQ